MGTDEREEFQEAVAKAVAKHVDAKIAKWALAGIPGFVCAAFLAGQNWNAITARVGAVEAESRATYSWMIDVRSGTYPIKEKPRGTAARYMAVRF